MERNEIKKQETNFLSQEYKKNPALFERKTFIDSPEFLETIGISIPDSENFVRGYLKLWPTDFIVEEISIDGSVETVDAEEFFDKNKTSFEGNPTVYATLVKCKLPTFEANREISLALGIDNKKIQYAGIKDADALTSQKISLRGGDIEKLKNLSSPYFFLKNVHTGKGVMEIGSLKGNRFTILVRTNAPVNEKAFLERIKKNGKEGFYNFFYSQRFGSPRFINWFWGLLILKGEYKNAVLSFLSSEGQREILYFKNLREKIKNDFGNWEKVEEIIKPFPISLQNEIKVIKYLKKNPNDFAGALKQISDQVQLWVYAYASLLFNRKISEILKKGNSLPEKLPLILSNDKNDWMLYSDFLSEDGIYAMPLKNLLPFPDIQWKKREIKTIEKAEIHNVKIIPEGVILEFSLPKGCYATALLSHLFQLTTGLPPKDISEKVIDTKEYLGQKPVKEVIKKFESIIFSKTENIFEKSE